MSDQAEPIPEWITRGKSLLISLIGKFIPNPD